MYLVVMVAVLNEETGEAETKCTLRRDDSFGVSETFPDLR